MPLHAKFLEGAWTLACRPCDFQDDRQDEGLDDQSSYNVDVQGSRLSVVVLTVTGRLVTR